MKKTENISALYRFFCWCSGARIYILKQCPTEYNKYFGIGIIIFFTGIMASISGGFAIYSVFKNLFFAITFGLFWGILIFFIDWYLIAGMRKESEQKAQWLTAMPRIILAVLLAIVISKPLELKIFENEITAQIIIDQKKKQIEYKNLVTEEYDEITKLESQNKDMQDKISGLQNKRDVLFKMLIAEAEGKSNTKTPGKGPVYREKKQEFEVLTERLANTKAELQPKIQNNELIINKLRNKKNQKLYTEQTEKETAIGLLAQIKALNNLEKENTAVKYASWFILLLFITIESAPVLAKLMAKRGPYEELLEVNEYEIYVNTKKNIFTINTNAENYLTLTAEKKKMEAEMEIKTDKDFINHLTALKKDANTERINHLKTKINNDSINPDEYDKIINKMLNEIIIDKHPQKTSKS